MKELTPRQAEILRQVTRLYIATGRPVGSKSLRRECGFSVSASTIRSELARLEEMGYLDHPHTSAGRVPTDHGYRFYVDSSGAGEGRRARCEIEPQALGDEIGDAIRYAAALLARTTGFLAMVSSPEQGDITIRHVEVLQLQPDLVTVVVITGSGGVARKLFVFDEPVDPGLVNWARGYLNDAVTGLYLGSRLLRLRLAEADLGPREREFIDAISPALLESPAGQGENLVMEGAPALLARLEAENGFRARDLVEMLERQDELLAILRSALVEYRVYLRIGSELPAAAMQRCSLVAANYGLAHRNLGTVGVLGPRRMDYPAVIGSVEATARCLSEFIEEIY